MFIARAMRSCLVIRWQSAEVSRTVTSSIEWRRTIIVNVNEETHNQGSCRLVWLEEHKATNRVLVSQYLLVH